MEKIKIKKESWLVLLVYSVMMIAVIAYLYDSCCRHFLPMF